MTPDPPLQSPEDKQRSSPSHGPRSVTDSFRFAWEGVMFVLKSERHMRVHFTIMGLVLLAAWGLGVSATNFLHLLFAMALVLIAEMVNTAVEKAVDLLIDTYDPEVKIIKDIAAGGVFVAALFAAAVGAIVFLSNDRLLAVLSRLPAIPPRPHVGSLQLLIIGALLVASIVAGIKTATSRGRFLRGGAISGHTAMGFLVATSIIMLTDNAAVMALGLALAIMVSQSRMQARIHSASEVLFGAVLGTAVAVVVFMWPGG